MGNDIGEDSLFLDYGVSFLFPFDMAIDLKAFVLVLCGIQDRTTAEHQGIQHSRRWCEGKRKQEELGEDRQEI